MSGFVIVKKSKKYLSTIVECTFLLFFLIVIHKNCLKLLSYIVADPQYRMQLMASTLATAGEVIEFDDQEVGMTRCSRNIGSLVLRVLLQGTLFPGAEHGERVPECW